MPVYVYQVIRNDGSEGGTFEIQQSIKDVALTKHPVTGQEVRRVFQPPNLSTKHTPGREKKLTSDDSIAKAGFTKYVKDKVSGKYHRSVGTMGPSEIRRDYL